MYNLLKFTKIVNLKKKTGLNQTDEQGLTD